jgi:hypothetical protein
MIRPRSFRSAYCAVGLLLALITMTHCGVTQSTTAIRDADRLRTEVLLEDVRSYAAYELARGESYLRKARTAAGHSDHQTAIRLAQTARDAFVQARDVASQNKRKRYFKPYRLDWTKPVVP